ncbi:MAG: hypothetical protein ACLUES_07205 [Flavonifractor plautii]
MKRRLALSLAALLLLGCLTPALAAEGDAELSLYQQYGPLGRVAPGAEGRGGRP